MTSIIISVQIVCEYCHLIVFWLFFECFTVSSRSQNKCVSLPTFHPSSLFQQQAMHTLVYEGRLCKKKTRIPVFHNSKMEEEGVRGSIYTKKTSHAQKLLSSFSSQAFSLCRSSLSHYHWFKVLWEKSRIFLCISDVWPAVDHSTAQRRRSDRSHLHSGTNQPAQRVNICTEGKVLILSTGLMFVSQTEEAQRCFAFFCVFGLLYHSEVVDKWTEELRSNISGETNVMFCCSHSFGT